MDLKKTVALITVTCFLVPTVLGDLAAAARTEAALPQGYAQLLKGFAVPPAAGRVTAARDLGGARVVVNIQDLHCHPEVQRNIGRIIEALDRKYDLRQVYVEGAAGQVDTSWLGRISDPQLQKEVVEAMLRQGRLTGTEYYSVVSGKTGLLAGLEEDAVYRQNLVRLQKIHERQEEYRRLTAAMRQELEGIKARYFNARNRRVDEFIAQHRKGALDSEKYYSMLLKCAEKTNENAASLGNLSCIDLAAYPNLTGYLQVLASAKKLRLRNIARQLQEFTRFLQQKLPYSAWRLLKERTNEFRQLDDLYLYLGRIVREYRIDLNGSYPQLADFLAYVERSRRINPLELLREENRLIGEIHAGLSQGPAELEASFLVDFFGYFENYLSAQLSAEDYDYFMARSARFRELWAKYAGTQELARLAPEFAQLDEYYRVNLYRNECFLRRFPIATEAPRAAAAGQRDGERMLEEAGEVIVVVAGGFHTRGLEKLLEARGISYVSITPQITEGTAVSDASYASLVREQAAVLSSSLAPMLASIMAKLAEGSADAREEAKARSVVLETLLSAALAAHRDGGSLDRELTLLVNSLDWQGDLKVTVVRDKAGNPAQFVFSQQGVAALVYGLENGKLSLLSGDPAAMAAGAAATAPAAKLSSVAGASVVHLLSVENGKVRLDFAAMARLARESRMRPELRALLNPAYWLEDITLALPQADGENHITRGDLRFSGAVIVAGFLIAQLGGLLLPGANIAAIGAAAAAATFVSLAGKLTALLWHRTDVMTVDRELRSNNPFVRGHGLLHRFFDSVPSLRRFNDPRAEIVVHLLDVLLAAPAAALIAGEFLFRSSARQEARARREIEKDRQWKESIDARYSALVARYGYLPWKQLREVSSKDLEDYLADDKELRVLFTDEELLEYWPELVRAAVELKENAFYFFKYALPNWRDLIQSRQDLHNFVDGCIRIRQASTPVTTDTVFQNGLRDLRRSFSADFLRQNWQRFADLAASGRSRTALLFSTGLPAFSRLIRTGGDVVSVGRSLSRLFRRLGDNSALVDKDVFPMVKGKVQSSGELRRSVNAIYDIAMLAKYDSSAMSSAIQALGKRLEARRSRMTLEKGFAGMGRLTRSGLIRAASDVVRSLRFVLGKTPLAIFFDRALVRLAQAKQALQPVVVAPKEREDDLEDIVDSTVEALMEIKVKTVDGYEEEEAAIADELEDIFKAANAAHMEKHGPQAGLQAQPYGHTELIKADGSLRKSDEETLSLLLCRRELSFGAPVTVTLTDGSTVAGSFAGAYVFGYAQWLFVSGVTWIDGGMTRMLPLSRVRTISVADERGNVVEAARPAEIIAKSAFRGPTTGAAMTAGILSELSRKDALDALELERLMDSLGFLGLENGSKRGFPAEAFAFLSTRHDKGLSKLLAARYAKLAGSSLFVDAEEYFLLSVMAARKRAGLDEVSGGPVFKRFCELLDYSDSSIPRLPHMRGVMSMTVELCGADRFLSDVLDLLASPENKLSAQRSSFRKRKGSFLWLGIAQALASSSKPEKYAPRLAVAMAECDRVLEQSGREFDELPLVNIDLYDEILARTGYPADAYRRLSDERRYGLLLQLAERRQRKTGRELPGEIVSLFGKALDAMTPQTVREMSFGAALQVLKVVPRYYERMNKLQRAILDRIYDKYLDRMTEPALPDAEFIAGLQAAAEEGSGVPFKDLSDAFLDRLYRSDSFHSALKVKINDGTVRDEQIGALLAGVVESGRIAERTARERQRFYGVLGVIRGRRAQECLVRGFRAEQDLGVRGVIADQLQTRYQFARDLLFALYPDQVDAVAKIANYLPNFPTFLCNGFSQSPFVHPDGLRNFSEQIEAAAAHLTPEGLQGQTGNWTSLGAVQALIPHGRRTEGFVVDGYSLPHRIEQGREAAKDGGRNCISIRATPSDEERRIALKAKYENYQRKLVDANFEALRLINENTDSMTKAVARRILGCVESMLESLEELDPVNSEKARKIFRLLQGRFEIAYAALPEQGELPLEARESFTRLQPWTRLTDVTTVHTLINAVHTLGTEALTRTLRSGPSNTRVKVGGEEIVIANLGDRQLFEGARITSRPLRQLLKAYGRAKSWGQRSPFVVIDDYVSWGTTLGKHRVELSAELKAPDEGGNFRVRYFEGGNDEGNELRRLYIITVLEGLGAAVNARTDESGDHMVEAVFDKDHGATTTAQIEKAFTLFVRALFPTANLDWAFEAIYYSKHGDFNNRSDKAMEFARQTVIDMAKIFLAEGRLPFYKISDDNTDLTMFNEYNGYRNLSFVRENLRARLNYLLREWGLPQIPKDIHFGQEVIEEYYTAEVILAVARGELVRSDDGERPYVRNPSYAPLRTLVTAALARGEELLRTAQTLGGLPADLLRFRTIGYAGSLEAVTLQLEFEGGEWFVVNGLREPGSGRLVYAQAYRGDGWGKLSELSPEQLASFLSSNGHAVAAAETPGASLRRHAEELLRAEPDAAAGAAGLAHGLAASAGKGGWTAGRITFDRSYAKGGTESGSTVFAAPFTTPDDLEAIRGAAGVITTGGGMLSHAGITTREFGVPAVILSGAQWTGNERINTVSRHPGGFSRDGSGIWVSEGVVEEEISLAQGDIVLVNGRDGLVRIFPKDSQALLTAGLDMLTGTTAAGEAGRKLYDTVKRLKRQKQFSSSALVELGKFLVLYSSARELSPAEEEKAAAMLRVIRQLADAEALRQLESFEDESIAAAVAAWDKAFAEAEKQPGGAPALADGLERRLNDIRQLLERFSRDAGQLKEREERTSAFRAQLEKERTAMRSWLEAEVKMLAAKELSTADLPRLRRLLRRAVQAGLERRGALAALAERERTLTAEKRTAVETAVRPVYALGEIDEDHVELVGGKAAKLGELLRVVRENGGYVPEGLALSTRAFEQFLADAGIQADFYSLTRELDEKLAALSNDAAARRAAIEFYGAAIRKLIASARFRQDSALGSAILQALTDHGMGADLLAVRSSAVQEDTEEAAFAGAAESFLYVSRDQVLERVRESWISFWLTRGIEYRARQGIRQSDVKPAVLLQTMVDAEAAGVIFTVNPVTGRDEIVINASYGLGETVVSGRGEGDLYTLGRTNGEETAFPVIGRKTTMIVRRKGASGTVEVPVTGRRQQQRCLAPAMTARLARIAAALEEYFGYPLDIEFAVEGERIAILQARPVTTRSGDAVVSAATQFAAAGQGLFTDYLNFYLAQLLCDRVPTEQSRRLLQATMEPAGNYIVSQALEASLVRVHRIADRIVNINPKAGGGDREYVDEPQSGGKVRLIDSQAMAALPELKALLTRCAGSLEATREAIRDPESLAAFYEALGKLDGVYSRGSRNNRRWREIVEAILQVKRSTGEPQQLSAAIDVLRNKVHNNGNNFLEYAPDARPLLHFLDLTKKGAPGEDLAFALANAHRSVAQAYRAACPEADAARGGIIQRFLERYLDLRTKRYLAGAAGSADEIMAQLPELRRQWSAEYARSVAPWRENIAAFAAAAGVSVIALAVTAALGIVDPGFFIRAAWFIAWPLFFGAHLVPGASGERAPRTNLIAAGAIAGANILIGLPLLFMPLSLPFAAAYAAAVGASFVVHRGVNALLTPKEGAAASSALAFALLSKPLALIGGIKRSLARRFAAVDPALTDGTLIQTGSDAEQVLQKAADAQLRGASSLAVLASPAGESRGEVRRIFLEINGTRKLVGMQAELRTVKTSGGTVQVPVLYLAIAAEELGAGAESAAAQAEYIQKSFDIFDGRNFRALALVADAAVFHGIRGGLADTAYIVDGRTEDLPWQEAVKADRIIPGLYSGVETKRFLQLCGETIRNKRRSGVIRGRELTLSLDWKMVARALAERSAALREIVRGSGTGNIRLTNLPAAGETERWKEVERTIAALRAMDIEVLGGYRVRQEGKLDTALGEAIAGRVAAATGERSAKFGGMEIDARELTVDAATLASWLNSIAALRKDARITVLLPAAMPLASIEKLLADNVSVSGTKKRVRVELAAGFSLLEMMERLDTLCQGDVDAVDIAVEGEVLNGALVTLARGLRHFIETPATVYETAVSRPELAESAEGTELATCRAARELFLKNDRVSEEGAAALLARMEALLKTFRDRSPMQDDLRRILQGTGTAKEKAEKLEALYRGRRENVLALRYLRQQGRRGFEQEKDLRSFGRLLRLFDERADDIAGRIGGGGLSIDARELEILKALGRQELLQAVETLRQAGKLVVAEGAARSGVIEQLERYAASDNVSYGDVMAAAAKAKEEIEGRAGTSNDPLALIDLFRILDLLSNERLRLEKKAAQPALNIQSTMALLGAA